MSTTNREAAMALAREGLRVFPLPPRTKRTNMHRWQELATADHAQVAAWFPVIVENELLGDVESNVAIATGHGLLVLDEDPRHGSDASIVELERAHGKLPETRTARTPSGGRHRFYRVPIDRSVPNSVSKLGAGLDIRGDGGYVAAAPSTTDVGAYTWDNPGATIALAPPWLIETATTPRKPKELVTDSSTSEVNTHNMTLANLREMLSVLDPSCDYEQWFEIIVATRRASLGAQDGSTERDWFEALNEWSSRSPKYAGRDDVFAKWQQADTRGFGYGLGHLIELAKANGYKPPARVAASDPSIFPPVKQDMSLLVDVIPSSALPSLTFQKLPADWQNTSPPPRRWIVENLLSAQTATLLISMGGMGKSFLTLLLALCIAIGIAFCGQPCEQGRVVILSAEDEFQEIWRRLIRLKTHLGLLLPPNAAELMRQNIEVADVKSWRRELGTSPVLTANDHGGVIVTPFTSHVAREIGKAKLVVFDTVSRFNGCEENSNEAAARLIDAFEMIAEQTDSAVLALAHTGLKGRVEEVNQYSARGASAFSDNARSVLVLAPLESKLVSQLISPDQIAKAGHNDLLRLVHVKSNYSARLDDVHFERHNYGVLMPTTLQLSEPSTESDLVDQLVDKVGTGEISRGAIKNHYVDWFGPTVTREKALAAFDAAVRSNRLMPTRTSNNTQYYRVRTLSTVVAKDADATPPAANDDLIGVTP